MNRKEMFYLVALFEAIAILVLVNWAVEVALFGWPVPEPVATVWGIAFLSGAFFLPFFGRIVDRAVWESCRQKRMNRRCES